MKVITNVTNPADRSIIREKAVWANCNSDYLVRVIGWATINHNPAIIMELGDKSLREAINRRELTTLKMKYECLRDIAYGIKDLHERSIIHRDLKVSPSPTHSP